MRHGYITISVDWQQPHQFEYNGSLREHAAVLSALADAVRRFSVDTDRVFPHRPRPWGATPSGTSGSPTPDLWAGVIPILGVPTKFVPALPRKRHVHRLVHRAG